MPFTRPITRCWSVTVYFCTDLSPFHAYLAPTSWLFTLESENEEQQGHFTVNVPQTTLGVADEMVYVTFLFFLWGLDGSFGTAVRPWSVLLFNKPRAGMLLLHFADFCFCRQSPKLHLNHSVLNVRKLGQPANFLKHQKPHIYKSLFFLSKRKSPLSLPPYGHRNFWNVAFIWR